MKLVQSNVGDRVNESELDKFEILVAQNADTYRGGFAWSVSLGNQELGCGLELSRRFAEKTANKYARSLAVRP